MNYIVSLYFEINPNVNYQGISDTVARLTAATFSLAPIYLTTPNSSPTIWCTISATLCSILLFISSQTSNIYLCYISFCLFYGIMSFTSTQVSSSIGMGLDITLFGVLFTINTFISVCIEATIQYIVDHMQMTARDTFVTFSIHMLVTSCIIAFIGLFIYVRHRSRTQFTVLHQQIHNDKDTRNSSNKNGSNDVVANGQSYDNY
jgi:hypothetical protein